MEILELRSYNNLAQHEMCPIFFFKNHSHTTAYQRLPNPNYHSRALASTVRSQEFEARRAIKVLTR